MKLIIVHLSLLFIHSLLIVINITNIKKEIIILKYRKDLQFNEEVIKLIINLINNIKNVTNENNVFKFTFEKNLIINENNIKYKR